MPVTPAFRPKINYHKSASERSLYLVSATLGIPLKKPVDAVRATLAGIAPSAMDALKKAGFSSAELSWIVPARTLTHRVKKHERLTAEESGRCLRVAKLYALAVEVLGNKTKALDWMHKPRKAFDAMNAMDMMKTEAGAPLVEELLIQLDAGYVA